MEVGNTNPIPTNAARLPIESVIWRVSNTASSRLASESRFSAKSGFRRNGPNCRPLVEPTATMLSTTPTISNVVRDDDACESLMLSHTVPARTPNKSCNPNVTRRHRPVPARLNSSHVFQTRTPAPLRAVDAEAWTGSRSRMFAPVMPAFPLARALSTSMKYR